MILKKFFPKEIYYEPEALKYELGKYLKEKFSSVKWISIENHNNIPYFRQMQNREFLKIKQNIIIGVRKTHKYKENHKISDYLVPYTSSGCSASCLYCYLVCHYNKCSYLRLFVNREQMLNKLINKSKNSTKLLTFEIGSNSDLILENTITNNLPWTIENFAKKGSGFLTFPTKFNMVTPLLNLKHSGKTIIRVSVNPEYIINKVELGTSSLNDRIRALNMLCDSEYPVGILIAPVIMIENWKSLYIELLDTLESLLSKKVKDSMTIEIIFMTYSYIHRIINSQAFPNAIDLFDKLQMTGGGFGKYYYKKNLKQKVETFLKYEISKRFPNAKIVYIV